MKNLTEHFKNALIERSDRSAWDKGVTLYALELLETISETDQEISNIKDLERAILGGALSWHEYSYGGCALIYDADIAARLCSPSEYKRSREGERRPNSREEWLDVQARALKQAYTRLSRIYNRR